jgi:trigger factor
MHEQIQRAGADWGAYLQMIGKSEDEFGAEVDEQARRSVRVGLILDQIARQEELGVDDAELSWFVTQQAERMGVQPELLARQIAEGGQIGSAVSEVLRGKAIALLTGRVTIRDEAGNELDYNELMGITPEDAEAAEAAAGETADGGDAGPAVDAVDAVDAAAEPAPAEPVTEDEAAPTASAGAEGQDEDAKAEVSGGPAE